MNTLSIFIYLAGVVGNLVSILGFACLVLFALAIITGIASHFIWNYNPYGYSEEHATQARELHAKTKKVFPYIVSALIVCVGLIAVIPSEKTIYLIAASEIGEVIVQDELVQEIRLTILDNLKRLRNAE